MGRGNGLALAILDYYAGFLNLAVVGVRSLGQADLAGLVDGGHLAGGVAALSTDVLDLTILGRGGFGDHFLILVTGNSAGSLTTVTGLIAIVGIGMGNGRAYFSAIVTLCVAACRICMG